MDAIKLLTMILVIILGLLVMFLIILGIVFITSKSNKKEK